LSHSSCPSRYIFSVVHLPCLPPCPLCSFCFFTDPPPTEIYTLSLHDALPISACSSSRRLAIALLRFAAWFLWMTPLLTALSSERDRKSTRLNSSHVSISYAVFCLKKKKQINPVTRDALCIHTTRNLECHPVQH